MDGGFEALVRELGLADDELLLRASKRAGRDGVALVRAMVDEGVDETLLAEQLATRLELPLVLLDGHSSDAERGAQEEAAREVPHSLALAHALVPLAVDRSAASPSLRMAMANPLDQAAIEEVEAASGLKVVPVVASVSRVMKRARRLYRGTITEMIARRPGFGVTGDGQPLEPKTAPLHRVRSDASIEVRLAALIELLEESGVVDAIELAERVRRLQQESDG